MIVDSFDELFVLAVKHKLLLNSYHQLNDGVFVANWRRCEGDTPKFFNARRSHLPFEAVAFALEDAIAGCPALAEPELDLFGEAELDLFGEAVVTETLDAPSETAEQSILRDL